VRSFEPFSLGPARPERGISGVRAWWRQSRIEIIAWLCERGVLSAHKQSK
jgi:hypothetical protein